MELLKIKRPLSNNYSTVPAGANDVTDRLLQCCVKRIVQPLGQTHKHTYYTTVVFSGTYRQKNQRVEVKLCFRYVGIMQSIVNNTW